MSQHEKIDAHLDSVLRASGSALRHYSMKKSIDDMRMAMSAAMNSETESLLAQNERLLDAGKKALDAMDSAKKLLKSAGFTMEGGTISAPYSEAMDNLRAALKGGAT